MSSRIGTFLWNTNPLWFIGAVLLIQLAAFAGGYLPLSLIPTIALVMTLAYMQNTTYGLQSRSANRNSNAYHAAAALAANFTFFWSLRLLVRNELPPTLLAPYVFATIFGTLHGNAISIKIESALGLSAEGAKGRPQLLKLWPTVAFLAGVLALEVAKPFLPEPLARMAGAAFVAGTVILGIFALPLAVVWRVFLPTLHLRVWVRQWLVVGGTVVLASGVYHFSPSSHAGFGGSWVLIALLVLTVVDSFSFSLLRVARSTDHYWFHAGAVVLNLGIGFLRLLIMVNNRFDWALFLPTTTGSIIGSLIGANIAQEAGKKIKAAFDAHVSSGVKVRWPARQLWVLSVALVIHLAIFGIGGVQAGIILLVVSAWQAVSFTMVSRARQRNSAQYLAWTSVFSNGVWYLCMHYLAQGTITAEKAVPYIAGNAGGSLIGQNLAMKAEQATGALTK